ncbi:phosphatidylserine decarboxylase 1 [Sarracenia purpurea var. burkii]
MLEKSVGVSEYDETPLVERLDFMANAVESLKASHELHVVQTNTKFNKLEEARDKGIEFEFQPDAKATFLRSLPLCSISRFWGFLAGVVSVLLFKQQLIIAF